MSKRFARRCSCVPHYRLLAQGVERGLAIDGPLPGNYSIARFPLGPQSTVADRFNQEFGLNLSWDPNK